MYQSTNSVLSLSSLFHDGDSIQKHLKGRFEQTLIKTRDYDINLITLMDHQDGSGSFYEVQTHADEQVHKFYAMEMIEAFVDGYMIELKKVAPVTINIKEIPFSMCNWHKDKMVVNDIFTIVEVQDLKNGFARGMVRQSDLTQVKRYSFLTVY